MLCMERSSLPVLSSRLDPPVTADPRITTKSVIRTIRGDIASSNIKNKMVLYCTDIGLYNQGYETQALFIHVIFSMYITLEQID